MAIRRAALAPSVATPNVDTSRPATAPLTPSAPARGATDINIKAVKRATLERRYHQTVKRVDVWSVLKVSLCFYLCALIVSLVAGMMLWLVADAFGAIHNIEKFFGDLFDDKGFHFLSGEILRAATLIGLALVCLMTMWTVLAAAFYNLFAELVGGIEVVVSEDS
jgi:hypothetical protein